MEDKRGRPSSPSQQQGLGEGEWWFLQSVSDNSIHWSMLLSVKTSLLDSTNKTIFAWTTSQPLVWQSNELDMSFVILRHVYFLFRSVIRPASVLFPFCFIRKPFNLHWMVGCFFKTLMVTHFTPHGWGKMGHSRNKKKGGLPPLKFIF